MVMDQIDILAWATPVDFGQQQSRDSCISVVQAPTDTAVLRSIPISDTLDFSFITNIFNVDITVNVLSSLLYFKNINMSNIFQGSV